MEVHHHPNLHHKSKNFKEYLLEFLMIFLAVTMGFIAENIRERFLEKEIEKRNIESFIHNLESDKAGLTKSIKFSENRMKWTDTLTQLPGAFTDTSYVKSFFYYAIKLQWVEGYKPDESAFLQMQSSNTLRLITKQNVADSILQYHQNNIYILQEQASVDKANNSATDYFIQIADFRKIPNLKLNENHQQIQNYINYKIVEYYTTENYINMALKPQLQRAINLIPFLKKEYGIE